MNEVDTFIMGIIIGCAIARYFVGVGNKISMKAQDGDAINTKHKVMEQESTE